SWAGWHQIQAQRLSEEVVTTEGLDSIEVGLAQADEPNHGCSHLTVTDLRKWMSRQHHLI
ncbi:hypothetical protein LM599_00170, partial [Candidatus Acetothermia bacterium]|nr:hypothetical protein [Candidatus Acetothermia bacterium]